MIEKKKTVVEKKKSSIKEDSKINKISWKAGNMLYPLPAVMVSLTDKEGNSNIINSCMGGDYMYQSAHAFCVYKT